MALAFQLFVGPKIHTFTTWKHKTLVVRNQQFSCKSHIDSLNSITK